MCTWVLTHSTGEGGRRSTEGSNRQTIMTVMTHCSWGPAEFHSAKRVEPQVSKASVSAAGLLHSCEELGLWQCGGLLRRRSVWRKNGKRTILHRILYIYCIYTVCIYTKYIHYLSKVWTYLPIHRFFPLFWIFSTL